MIPEVKDWLERCGLDEHLQLFVDNEIDLDAARDLNEQDLKELGLAMGPRKKFLRAIAALNRDDAADTAETSSATPTNQGRSIPSIGERRQVTVLFADISGYTKLSGELDAESTHGLLATYFDEVDAIIERFGGSVDKHIGDSVMAVFGAPVSHGNDPERALRAAAAIHDAMPAVSKSVGRTVQVHIGVASGQVVASGVGANEAYTVTGESVNLASRLTDKAGPNETLISETVMLAVEADCTTEDLGSLSLKGIVDPVRAFRVLELSRSEHRTNARPFVGRQVELQQLNALLTTTAETHMGHAVCLRGEAGIGKTRIAEEFENQASLQDFNCHRALVLDFGAGKGQDAIRSLTRSLLSLTSSSSEDQLRFAVESAVQNNILHKDQVVFLNDLLDLPQPREYRSLYSAMNNVRRNQGKCETVANLVRQIAKTEKLLLIIEDIHWASSLVLDHLAELTRAIADCPVILMMTSRLEGEKLDDPWRAATGSTPLITIDLRPLRRADAIALASEFFDTADKFAKSCVERAEGNPLFLEQLLRGAKSAAEDGVPGSIQSIVQARVDALSTSDKLAIQGAAILGQRFTLDKLRAVLGDNTYDCRPLIDRHLIRADGDAFLFAHALVRDGVYNSLLTPSRNRLHVKAAACYREHDPILYAQHLDRAGDERAAKAYLQAAQVQAQALRYESAISLSQRGLVLAVNAADICDLNGVLGDGLLNTLATEQAIEAFEIAADEAPDKPRKSKALSGLAAALRIADRQEPALEALSEAERLATQEELIAELAYIHYLRGSLCFPLGRIDECMAEHDKSLKLAEEIKSPEAQARALSGLADAHYLRGHMKTACERFKASVELCQQHGLGQLEVANLHMIGWSRLHLMEFRQALEDALASEAMASEVRNNRSLMFGKKLAGLMYYYLGELELSEDYLGSAIELAKSMSSANFQAQDLRQLAMIHYRRGNPELARDCANEALEAVRQVGMTFIGPTVLATCAALSDNSEERQRLLAEAESILDSGCVGHNQLWFADIAIDDAISRRDWQSAERYAQRLEQFTASQPLEWSNFMIRRARALVQANQGDATEATIVELGVLKEQAQTSGLVASLPELELALGGRQ